MILTQRGAIRATRSRRAPRERGAVLVEAAIALPLVVLVVIGIIEFAFAYQSRAVLDDATRGAGRAASTLASTEDFADRIATVASERMSGRIGTVTPLYLLVYEANDDGKPGGPGNTSLGIAEVDACGAGNENCLLYAWEDETRAFEAAGGFWDSDAHEACVHLYTRIGVAILIAYEPVTGLFDQFLARDSSSPMTGHAAYVFEPNPGAC
jgi:hypothetical protein